MDQLESLNFVSGKWVKSESGQTFQNVNPAHASQKVGTFQSSTREDTIAAIESAKAAFPSWANTPAPQRGKILLAASNFLESEQSELAKILTEEEGKTLSESKGEVQRAIDIFRFYAGIGSRLQGKTFQSGFKQTFLYSVREPLGVVAIMTPWNFPIAIPAWKIAPALISGNAVVFKPASLTPGIAQRLVSALERGGLPRGVLNFVTGAGSTVGTELSTNSGIDAISFTGSYEVGHGINRARANAEKMARIQLEMGGKNPMIVLPDANLDEAANLVARSGFGLTGQACTATSRVIVQEQVKEKFLEKLVGEAKKTKVGDGLAPDTVMGPAVSKPELEKDLRYVDIGKNEGAKLVTGGERGNASDLSDGFFIEPTIFDDVAPDMKIAREEIFGPVISVMNARNVDDAIEICNNAEFGLTAGICTSSLSSALNFADRAEAGVIKINKMTTGLELHVPFGGFKKSSANTFKEQGEETIDFYTRTKMVYIGF